MLVLVLVLFRVMVEMLSLFNLPLAMQLVAVQIYHEGLLLVPTETLIEVDQFLVIWAPFRVTDEILQQQLLLLLNVIFRQLLHITT